LVLHFYAALYGMPIVFANRVGREGPDRLVKMLGVPEGVRQA